jgi:hypothetical protein
MGEGKLAVAFLRSLEAWLSRDSRCEPGGTRRLAVWLTAGQTVVRHLGLLDHSSCAGLCARIAVATHSAPSFCTAVM